MATHTRFLRVEDVRELLRKEVDRAGNQSALAKQIGIYPNYVNKVLKGKRRPGREVLKALGLREVRAYERVKD